jgi:hypothetical protein
MTWNPQTVTLGVLTCQEFESVPPAVQREIEEGTADLRARYPPYWFRREARWVLDAGAPGTRHTVALEQRGAERHRVSRPRGSWHKSRSAAPGSQGATSEHTGRM